MKKISLLLMAAFVALTSSAAVTINKSSGWFETAYVTWQNVSGQTYTVFVRPQGGAYTQLDNELVRNYGSYGRADALGLAAGNYQLKVVASNGEEAETPVLTVVAHDRNGFAHYNRAEGVGAYNNDGTLKTNARVIYLHANNAKTVKCMVMGDRDVEYTGIQAILAAFEKGKETRPLCVRIIGTVKRSDLDAIGSSAEGLQVKGKNGSTPMNITIEGVGDDATFHGFGFLLRSTCSVELRNFAIMSCMDDCISLDTDNHYDWVHSMDFFYGNAGSDSDQAKGDGTVDIKGKSSHITVSYNHFFDSGKCSLGGMKSETTDCWMTYHHNWFDHSDSRHPRIRTAFYHCYNNYYDGIAKYGVGVTCGGSSFVESNYFRNCKYPMLISKQGTDAEGDGTFSGENGGINKAYNNIVLNPRKLQYYNGTQTDGKWDAVLAATRGENVSVTCLTGGTGYNNAADAAARQAVPDAAIDPVNQVALICRGEVAGRPGAGRCEGGDFKWLFDYRAQDDNYDVITDLKQAVVGYRSTLVGLYTGTTSINNGGATATVNGGDGQGLTQAIDSTTAKPSWAGGGVDENEHLVIGFRDSEGDEDFYWFNKLDSLQTLSYIAAGNIILGTSKHNPSGFASSSSDTSFKDPYTGAIVVSKNDHADFFYADTISTFVFNATRAGSASGKVQKSDNGSSFTDVEAYSTTKKGNFTISKRIGARYVRVTNGSSGTLYIHGIKVYSKIPAAPTAVENLFVAPAEVHKFYRNGQLFILRDGRLYNMQGMLVQ